MLSRKYNKSDDKALVNVVKSADKLTQACVIVTVLTAILCIVKIIFTISNIEYDDPPTYYTDYTYYDYMIFHLLIGDILLSLAIIAVEIFVCRIASHLSSLAELLLKNNTEGGATKEADTKASQWKCPDCGKVNENYVGTCGCGKTKI